MALVEINRNPARRDLTWFGATLWLFFAILGGIFLWRFHAHRVGLALLGGGSGLVLLYYVAPGLRRAIYLTWSYVTFPLGWLLGHAVMGLTYYVVLTPVGLIRRVVGGDPLERHFEPGARTYWVRHDPGADRRRYLRQY